MINEKFFKKVVLIISIPIAFFLFILWVYKYNHPKLILDYFENLDEIEFHLQINRSDYEMFNVSDNEQLEFLYNTLLQVSKNKVSKINKHPEHISSYQRDPYIIIKLIYKDKYQKIYIDYNRSFYFFLETVGSSSDPGYVVISGSELIDIIAYFVEEHIGSKDYRFHSE